VDFDPAVSFYMRIPLGDGSYTNGHIDYSRHPELLGMAQADLSETRVLDVATHDGFWAFWAEDRGARDVVAIDVDSFEDYDWSFGGPPEWVDEYRWGSGFATQWQSPAARFEAIRQYRESAVERRSMSVYDASRSVLGEFDLVFSYGLLYHLRHPVLAIDRLREVTRGALVLETHVVNSFPQLPVSFFYEVDEFREPTNWTGPTEAAVAAWLRSSGFTDIWVRRPRGDSPNGRAIFAAALQSDWAEMFGRSPSLTFLDDDYFERVARASQGLPAGRGTTGSARAVEPSAESLPEGDGPPQPEHLVSHADLLGINGTEMAHRRVLEVGRSGSHWVSWALDRGAQLSSAISLEPARVADETHHVDAGSQLRWSSAVDPDRAGGAELQARLARGVGIYDLDPVWDGQFDLIFCHGLLTELRYPLLALDKLRLACRGAMIVETRIAGALASLPASVFMPAGANGSSDGTVLPSEPLVAAWLRSAGFTDLWTCESPRGQGRDSSLLVVSVSAEWSSLFDSAPALTRIDDEYVERARLEMKAVIGD
jgi:tRNA (mo5U34)-methyltransferase